MKHRYRCVVLIAVVCSLAFTLLPSAFAARLDPFDPIERALGLVEQGDFAGARLTLQRMPASDETTLTRLAARGMVALAAGETAEAAVTFRAVLDDNPQQLSALWGLSLCLLQQAKVHEAATYISRAAAIAPNNRQVQALQAYAYTLLGQISDAALTGKAALERGDTSPFLMATLAQTHYRMGYGAKAVEFGSLAAKSFYGSDILKPGNGVRLPMTMLVFSDTPGVLTPELPASPSAATDEDGVLSFASLPLPTAAEAKQDISRLHITQPKPGSTVRGMQRVQTVYRGRLEISFVVFLVDNVLRGMVTELPYHFSWNADADTAGLHQLSVRAYDPRGILIEENNLTVYSSTGKPSAGIEPTKRMAALEQRMLQLTQPSPEPLSLYANLGKWHRELGETTQAINALEKAVTLDPQNDQLLRLLNSLYRDRGLHAISPTGEVMRGAPAARKRVAFTFDDGPNPLYTPSLLAELKRYHASATFFVVGKMVQRYPDLTLDILAEGHELANHTYNHPNLTKLTPSEIIREMLQARTVIKDITGRDTYLFRPPGGNIDAMVTRELRALDYNIIYWSINAGEYRNYPPEEQAARMLSRIEDGSVLLLHNGPVDGTLSILPILLAELHKRGYAFVTVSELMQEAQ